MSIQKLRMSVGGAVAAALLAPFAPDVRAQNQPAAGVLDEIIVSARRREENLQTVPLAITAFTGESLEARGIDMVGNMNAMAPNLSVHGGAGPRDRVDRDFPRARRAGRRRLRRRHRPNEHDRSLHDGRRRGRPHRSVTRPARHAVRQFRARRSRPLRDTPAVGRIRSARADTRRHVRSASTSRRSVDVPLTR